MKFELVSLFIILILFSGCFETGVQTSAETVTNIASQSAELNDLQSAEMKRMQEETAKQTCIKLCTDSFAMGIDLSNGPCIGNPIEQMPDYVCDIAHNPRTDIDNLPENQCSAFRENNAEHFIELDENCELITID